MKKLLLIAAGATALTATPAMASDQLNITATATVAPTCTLGAFVRTDTNVQNAGVSIGYDDANGVELAETSATSTVNLALTTAQTVASISASGNVNCNVSVSTTNDFKLNNGSSNIPYGLRLTGGGQSATASSGSLSLTYGTGNSATAQTRSLQLTFPTAANPVNLAPGAYSDTILVTVSPSV